MTLFPSISHWCEMKGKDMHCKLTEQQVEALKTVSDNPADPIRENEQGFWFYDETWSDIHGPYATLDECKSQLSAYAATL